MKAIRIRQNGAGSYNTSAISSTRNSFLIINEFDIYFSEDNVECAIKNLYNKGRKLYANNTVYKTERGAINAIKKIFKTRR